MHMTIGIKEDLIIKTENIMLYKFNDVYFPDNSYYNSDPLPVEWIEVFQENQELKEHQALMKGSKMDLNHSKEVSLFQDDGSVSKQDSKSIGKPERDYYSSKIMNPEQRSKTKKVEDKQVEINGFSHASIKKTLGIYSLISNVNKDIIKDEISGLDENDNESQIKEKETLKLLAIEDQKTTQKKVEEDENTSFSSKENLPNILATVEEDEKNLNHQLSVLQKREKLIAQLHSNVSKNSYRKCVKQAEQFEIAHSKEFRQLAYNKERSVRTRVNMYKSYKNLKNGKIHLGRKESSLLESGRSESRRLSASGQGSYRSNYSKRIKLAGTKTGDMKSFDESGEIHSEVENHGECKNKQLKKLIKDELQDNKGRPPISKPKGKKKQRKFPVERLYGLKNSHGKSLPNL
jgi:hypothetical protein